MFEHRLYQSQIEDSVRKMIRDGKRIIVVQSETGSGKSFMQASVIKSAFQKGKRTLWIVHRRDLVNQFSCTLDEIGVPHTIAMSNNRIPRHKWYDVNSLVHVCSRDTYGSWKRNRKGWVQPKYDLAIVDEGHLFPGQTYQGILTPIIAQGSVVLLYTATPILGNGKGMGRFADGMVIGPRPSALIRNGYIVPMKVVSHNLVKGLKLALKDDKSLTSAAELQAEARLIQPKVIGDVVSHWERYGQGHRTICYAQTIAHSLALEKQFSDNGHRFVHIDGSTPMEDRKPIYEQLANWEIDGIVNVGVAGIGLDIPQVSCIQLACVTRSLIDWRQKAGRAKRAFEGKEYAILIDHCGAQSYLGHPDIDIEWSLDPGRNAYDLVKNAKKKEEDLDRDDTFSEITCPKCEHIFASMSICPNCGHEIKRSAKDREHDSGMLCMIDPWNKDFVDPEEVRKQQEEKNKNYWIRCLYLIGGIDGKMSAAAAKYKKETGEFPPNHFPHIVYGANWQRKVTELFPRFKRRQRGA
ncbi:MAG: DEAD/DEAH box helicase family protein [Candidatus Competibacteraceae bacterium]|nr:DEAD/DEAH box helicase family protein [Candidatus Competibacteraceae bacterium]